MKNTKRIFAMGMAALLAAGCVTGCGAPGASGGETAGGDTVYKVGVVQYADHPSLDNCREGFVLGLREAGLEEGKTWS